MKKITIQLPDGQHSGKYLMDLFAKVAIELFPGFYLEWVRVGEARIQNGKLIINKYPKVYSTFKKTCNRFLWWRTIEKKFINKNDYMLLCVNPEGGYNTEVSIEFLNIFPTSDWPYGYFESKFPVEWVYKIAEKFSQELYNDAAKAITKGNYYAKDQD